MNARRARSVLQRASRYTRSTAKAPSSPCEGGRRLDPAAVDAVLSDEVTHFRDEQPGDAAPAGSGPAVADAGQSVGLLTALRDQLAELESHQSTIRALLDQVERHAAAAGR